MLTLSDRSLRDEAVDRPSNSRPSRCHWPSCACSAARACQPAGGRLAGRVAASTARPARSRRQRHRRTPARNCRRRGQLSGCQGRCRALPLHTGPLDRQPSRRSVVMTRTRRSVNIDVVGAAILHGSMSVVELTGRRRRIGRRPPAARGGARDLFPERGVVSGRSGRSGTR
jgi:hypothetical protein